MPTRWHFANTSIRVNDHVIVTEGVLITLTSALILVHDVVGVGTVFFRQSAGFINDASTMR